MQDIYAEKMVGNKAAIDWIFKRLLTLLDEGVNGYEALHLVAGELKDEPWNVELAPLSPKAEMTPEDYQG